MNILYNSKSLLFLLLLVSDVLRKPWAPDPGWFSGCRTSIEGLEPKLCATIFAQISRILRRKFPDYRFLSCAPLFVQIRQIIAEAGEKCPFPYVYANCAQTFFSTFPCFIFANFSTM